MPTDHAEVSLRDVRVPATTRSSASVDHGLALAQHFVHENRIRQAASSLGAAQFCIDEAVAYASERHRLGQAAVAATRRSSSRSSSCTPRARWCASWSATPPWQLDRQHHMEVTDLVAMCNYRANRLACEAADRAMQTCGGIGYTRHMPFEHIYRHHRRYRITEGSEEIQMRKVGYELFKGV